MDVLRIYESDGLIGIFNVFSREKLSVKIETNKNTKIWLKILNKIFF